MSILFYRESERSRKRINAVDCAKLKMIALIFSGLFSAGSGERFSAAQVERDPSVGHRWRSQRTATCREPARLQGERSCLWACRKSLPGRYIAYKLSDVFYCLFSFLLVFPSCLSPTFLKFLFILFCASERQWRDCYPGREEGWLGTRCRWAGSLPAAGRFQSAGPCREVVPGAAARGRHVRARAARGGGGGGSRASASALPSKPRWGAGERCLL